MICAIVLAAGCSRRMGSQKLLLPFAGQTVIAHILDQISRSPVSQILVVLRKDDQAVAAALSGRTWTAVLNPDPAGEMLSSVRCGLWALPPGCTAVLVILGDQPAISPVLLGDMIHAHAARGRGLVTPVYAGQRGHPLLFSTRYRQEILTEHDSVGLRGLLQAHPDDIFELEVATPGILADMDQPDDYLRELRRLRDGG